MRNVTIYILKTLNWLNCNTVIFFVEKSPGTKTSAKMKPIEEGMEDDVFEESSPSKSRRLSSTSTEEV